MNELQQDPKFLIDQFITNLQIPYQEGIEFSIEAKLKQLFDLAANLHDISGTAEDDVTLTIKVSDTGTYTYHLDKAGSIMRTLLARMAFAINQMKYPKQIKEINRVVEIINPLNADKTDDSRSGELHQYADVATAIAHKTKELQKNGFNKLDPYGFETDFDYQVGLDKISFHVVTKNRNNSPLSFKVTSIDKK